MTTVAAQIERELNRQWWGEPGEGLSSFAVYDHPNPPCADEYAEVARELGYQVQQIVDSSNSTGCYYEVHAVYAADPDKFFGTEPLALIFEDYSRSVLLSWVIGDAEVPVVEERAA